MSDLVLTLRRPFGTAPSIPVRERFSFVFEWEFTPKCFFWQNLESRFIDTWKSYEFVGFLRIRRKLGSDLQDFLRIHMIFYEFVGFLANPDLLRIRRIV